MTNEEAILYLENALCELDAGIKIYSGTIKEEFIEQRECFITSLSALRKQAERNQARLDCAVAEANHMRTLERFLEAQERITELTAVDAVEVVFCKDCIYQKDAKVNCKGFIICSVSNMEITDDDYCSYGKRKAGQEV